jgi:hypothetical protein
LQLKRRTLAGLRHNVLRLLYRHPHLGLQMRTSLLGAVACLLSTSPCLGAQTPILAFGESPRARADTALEISSDAYILTLSGAGGHSGGYRYGATVAMSADTMVVAIGTYQASYYDPRDFVYTRWRLSVLRPQACGLTVRLVDVNALAAGKPALLLERHLAAPEGSCSGRTG